MRILYFAMDVDIEQRSASGVYQKILGQCRGLEENGHVCDVLLYDGSAYALLHEDRIESQGTAFHKAFLHQARRLFDRYETIYVRGCFFKTVYVQSIRLIRVLGCKCVVELPTYPILPELMGSARERWKQRNYMGALRSCLAGLLLQYGMVPWVAKRADRLVLIASDARIGKCDCVQIENGIDISVLSLHKPLNDGVFTIIGVANINYWHGYDRVLEGMAQYMQANGKRDVRLILVGDGQALPALQKIAIERSIEDAVMFAGKRFGADLDGLFNRADIAVSALGAHRKKLSRTSTLKSREYCARGIPYLMSAGESGSPQIARYLFHVPADDSPVDILAVKSWFEHLQMTDADRLEMRSYAATALQWSVQMRKAMEGLE